MTDEVKDPAEVAERNYHRTTAHTLAKALYETMASHAPEWAKLMSWAQLETREQDAWVAVADKAHRILVAGEELPR